ncbi:hypothetical protein [Alloprevotella tannerae]
MRRRTTPPPPTNLTFGSPTIKTYAFRRVKYVLPEAPFDCLVGANHRLPAAYYRLARANHRLVAANEQETANRNKTAGCYLFIYKGLVYRSSLLICSVFVCRLASRKRRDDEHNLHLRHRQLPFWHIE